MERECDDFEFSLRRADDARSNHRVTVTYNFSHRPEGDTTALMTVYGTNMSMSIHTTTTALVNMAAKILNELDNIKQEAAANG